MIPAGIAGLSVGAIYLGQSFGETNSVKSKTMTFGLESAIGGALVFVSGIVLFTEGSREVPVKSYSVLVPNKLSIGKVTTISWNF